VIKEGNPNLSLLEKAFLHQVEETKSKPMTEFHLVTRCHFSLSAEQDFDVEIDGTIAHFTSAQPKYDFVPFPSGRLGRVDLNEPSGGAYAVLPVWARGETAAFHAGSWSIDVVFGALTYALEFGNLSITANPGFPIARAFPGKEIGLFRPDGARCTENALFFSSVPFRVFSNTSDIEKRWERVRNSVLSTRRNESGYYKNFWRLYFHALAEPDVEGRVLRLWKIVEHLTFTNNESEASKRMATPFRAEDRELVSLVFDALRMRRNYIAHSVSSGIHQDGVFEVAREMIDKFVLRSASPEFPRLKDWRSFLELSVGNHSADQLERAAQIMRKRDPRG
jgi:hypothetical protein